MKTQEQVEKALEKWQNMLDANKRIMDWETDFMKAHSFMDDRAAYLQSATRYHEAEMVAYACEKLITNCKWILDIE